MSEAKIGGTFPIAVEVQANQAYWWCTCGRSAKQPFCDGAHKATSLSPLQWTAEASKTVYLCGCKATAREPFCDGAHNKL
jgi:CDGSH-type Zn-finger protein